MKLIVGLGNPGNEYERTRHNTGFMALDAITNAYDVTLNKKKFDGLYGEKLIDGEKYLFLKPLKYMNLSGEVVKKYVEFFKIPIENILIIHDDLDIPIGKYKIKIKGSGGGHNGVNNVQSNLGTDNYTRIKIGISNDKTLDMKDYVLGKFNIEELEILNKVIDRIVLIFKDYTKCNIIDVMSKYNNKDV